MMAVLRRKQVLAFALVWVTYCVTYFLRKPLGVLKPSLEADLNLSKSELGLIDMALMLSYSGVQIAGSTMWDNTVPRRLIALCLTGTSLAMLAFGASNSLWTVCAALLASGAAQAPIWPACTKALTAWYSEEKLSAVFGTLSTAPYVGALAGTALAVYVQDSMGWRWVFVPSGVAGIFVSLVVLAWLKSPSEMNVEVSGQVTSNSVRQHHTGYVKLWIIPAVPELTVAVFCLKFVRYCMFMWLPLYLIEYLGYDKTQGGLFSTLFDVGGILGGPLLGFFVDKYYSTRPMWGVYMMMGVGTLVFVLFGLIASWGVGYCCVLLLLAGACNCGPDSLLTGSIPMTIGEKFGRGDGAGVTSLVNGLGSIGAIIEGPIIGVVSQQVGWLGVICCMIGFSLAGTLATLKAFVVVRAEDKRRAESVQQEPV